MSRLLNLASVSKCYADKQVLNDINLSVYPGECVALLGKNGAGKTTLIKLITGILLPDVGEITLFSQSPQQVKARQNIGVTPQSMDFPKELTVKEVIQFAALHYPQQESVDELIKSFGLSEFINQQAGKLSGGQKRRLALALAFVGMPTMVFLDEPTTGLDIQSQQKLWEYISQYVKDGGAVFLTTHHLDEIETLATRILYLDKTTIKTDKLIAEFKSSIDMSIVSFMSPQPLSFVEKYEQFGQLYKCYTSEPEKFVADLLAKNKAISKLEIKQGSILNLFAKGKENSQ